MEKSIKVSASILCADFTRLGEEIKKCEDAGVDMLHVDVMDGHFVPNISIGHVIMESLRPITKLPIETHLMIENPWMYINDFAERGADIISIQLECYGKRTCGEKFGEYPKEVVSIDVDKMRMDLKKIRKLGVKAQVVVNPGTPLCFDELLEEIDGVLIMSVNPGFAKQAFMPVAVPKIKSLRDKFAGDISVDGGVKAETAPDCVKAGANILATASYFFGASDPKEAVKYLKSLNYS